MVSLDLLLKHLKVFLVDEDSLVIGDGVFLINIIFDDFVCKFVVKSLEVLLFLVLVFLVISMFYSPGGHMRGCYVFGRFLTPIPK